jgi:hypothetical protein
MFLSSFLGPLHWEGFFTGTKAHRVLLDTHPYFVYSDQEKQIGDSARLREVCAMEDTMRQSKENYPTIAGEWSVNGPNGDRASDRDLPTGPVSFPDGPSYPYSKKYMAFMARNYAVQTATFEKGSGWIFWAVSGYEETDEKNKQRNELISVFPFSSGRIEMPSIGLIRLDFSMVSEERRSCSHCSTLTPFPFLFLFDE